VSRPPRRRPATSRSRPSRQQFLVRRAVVAGAVLVLVVGSIWALASVIGGDGDGGGGLASDDTTPSTAVESAAATTIAAMPATTAAPTGPPTAESPAQVLVLGDSDAGTFGPYLSALLDETGVAETTVDYKVSSGLSRPDFFDWPAHIQATVPSAAPDIVVVTFGGNDAQDIRDRAGDIVEAGPTGNEEAWSAEYARRANEVLDLLQAEGRTVIWVGIPNDDNPEVTARLQVQDEAARAAVAAHPAVAFVDTWTRFSGRSGGWAEYVIDPRDGEGKDVRADDGFHLNETGAEILALDIARLVEAELRARGATL
jgi:hypothetical protein